MNGMFAVFGIVSKLHWPMQRMYQNTIDVIGRRRVFGQWALAHSVGEQVFADCATGSSDSVAAGPVDASSNAGNRYFFKQPVSDRARKTPSPSQAEKSRLSQGDSWSHCASANFRNWIPAIGIRALSNSEPKSSDRVNPFRFSAFIVLLLFSAIFFSITSHICSA